jgi:hypothetical protein
MSMLASSQSGQIDLNGEDSWKEAIISKFTSPIRAQVVLMLMSACQQEINSIPSAYQRNVESSV